MPEFITLGAGVALCFIYIYIYNVYIYIFYFFWLGLFLIQSYKMVASSSLAGRLLKVPETEVEGSCVITVSGATCT